MESSRPGSRGLMSRLIALAAFGAALGHLEAVVVVYLQHVLNIATPERIDRAVYEQIPRWVLVTEQGREAAMLIMLLGLAYLAGRRPLAKLAAFLFTLGLVDISFYASIKLLTDWPGSLQTTDLVVLIPAPWFAPVWVPVSIAAGMIAVALFLLAYEQKR